MTNGAGDPDRRAAILSALNSATSFAAAQAAIRELARTIGMPVVAWAPDVAHPAFHSDMDAFNREEGWPPDMMALWWDRRVMLKSPLYVRCRTSAAPFVISAEARLPKGRPELRRIAEAMLEIGARSLITVPVHLPRGQVAMIAFGGACDIEEARRRALELRGDLIAAGHLFMIAFLAQHPNVTDRDVEITNLTPREWECLRLTAQGLREDEVASVAGIAATTVRYHLDNVVRKLGATNRTHAVAVAAQLGILAPIS